MAALRRVPFTKMQGLGNDYIYVSLFGGREGLELPWPELARRWSDRHFGIGGDGLILIAPSTRAHARMRMFNADGSEGEMCGNGIRCVAKYLYDHGLCAEEAMRIETGRGILELGLEVEGGKARRVRVDMGAPILEAQRIPTTLPGDPPVNVRLEAEGGEYWATAVSMGNPHVVIYVPDVGEIPLERVGPALERHAAFPRRVNVHFVQVQSPSEARMRTWERGSGITLACGTGACAVCVAGILTGRTGPRLLVHLPGGDLDLEWRGAGHSVFMTGPAEEVYSGEVELAI
jgi:diaminopimelate epimerase